MSERNAAALRRLAIIGAQLADDRRDGVPDASDGMGDDERDPRYAPEPGSHLGPSARPRSPLPGDATGRPPRSVPLRFGGVGLTAHHVVVVIAVIAVFVALGAWWFVSARPSEVVPMSRIDEAGQPVIGEKPARPGAGDEASTAAGDEATPAGGKVVVDVTGKVRDPGIVSLRAGSRVVDAIKAAGGITNRRVDLSTVNLARVLVDGEQVIVGMPTATGTSPTVDGTTSGSTPTTVVNLNTATLEQLDTLPGVGPVTGQAILDWRSEHGQFTSVDELLEVDGIGEVTMEELRDLVTV